MSAWYRFAPMGPTLCARLGDPSGSLHAHSWPYGTTIGSARAQLRQVRLQYRWSAQPAGRRRWNGAMGQRLCDPPHDPRGCLHADYQPRGTVVGGAARLAKPVKSMSKWRKVPCERMVSFCSDGSDAVRPSRRPLWQPACPFLASWDHFRQCQGPAPAGAVAVSLVCTASRPPPLE